MTYIDSSTRSGLPLDDDEPQEITESSAVSDPDDDEMEDEGPAKPRPERQGTALQFLLDQIDDINLARYLDPQDLDTIGMRVVEEYRLDELSRQEWLDVTETAMNAATQKTQPKTFPWPGASNVIFPLIPQAALEFHARAYPAIVQGRKVVKGVVWGSDRGTPTTTDGKPPAQDGSNIEKDPQGQPIWLSKPGEKRARADRIAEHMSWQLLDEMPEWEPQTDQMLLQMPVTGGIARKTFRDPVEGRNKSLVVSLANLVWNYQAPSFEAAPRHTERVMLYPNEIVEWERTGAEDGEAGAFLPLDYGPAGGESERFGFHKDSGDATQGDDDAPHLFIEQNRRLDLDDDGYAEPYTVTVHLRSMKVVRIIARYDEDTIRATDKGETIVRVEPVEIYTLYPFFPNIDGGSYPMGFGHILHSIGGSINTVLNQMFDAGTLQNAGGGFVSDQLGVPSGQSLFQIGKFTRVNSKGGAIRDAVFPIPFQGPSPVLFQLLGVLLESGKAIASIGNVLAGDAAIANAPPTTILALIEQGMKVYTAIHKRVFRAEKAELAKLYRLNRKSIKDRAAYRVGDEWREVTEEDYRLGGGVEPIADPTMTTDMQKLGRAQLLMTFAADPTMNGQEIKRRLLDAASIDRIDELFAPPNPAQQAMMQMSMAQAQAELGRTRAAEMKDNTQAFLNLALARKNATAGEEAQIDAQLTYLRLQIEALNAQTRADQVHRESVHRHLSSILDTVNAHEDRQSAERIAAMKGGPDDIMPQPAPSGPFPQATVEPPPGPAFNRPAPGGLPAPDVPAPPLPTGP